MTERIYYRDPTILEFEASIIEMGKKGNHYFTVLDKTAFYPTSGGQLYDTGKLNGIAVTEVIEENGCIDTHERAVAFAEDQAEAWYGDADPDDAPF